MTFSAPSTAREIEEVLAGLGTPKRAEGEKRYLKSDLNFLGCTLGEIRAVVKSVAKKGELNRERLLNLVDALWDRPVFELRMAAVLLLDIHEAVLLSEDLDLIESFLRESETWALVDPLAGNVVGKMNLRMRIKSKLDRWARDDDFWIRRSSLLAELKPLRTGADFAPFAARAERMLDEKEFFIRKAIGWVLRDMSRKRPDEVYEWIALRTHRASGVTMREVVRRLPAPQAERLMTAYKEKRPSRSYG